MPRIPYHFGSPASEPYFCDRESELDALLARMGDGVHVFLLGARRYGKTSIIRRAEALFREQGGRAGYVDLIRCTSEAEVAQAVLTAVVQSVLSGPQRARETLEGLLRRLRIAPTVAIDSSGGVSLTFDPVLAARSWQAILDDALGILERSAQGTPTALALDEFQHVAEIGKGMGGVFKAAADRLTNVSLVFSGSHMSAMEKLTRARGAPLQGMGEMMVIDAIPREIMSAYLRERAESAGKALGEEALAQIHALAGEVPNDLQWLAYAAYEAASGKQIGVPAVNAGFEAIVARQSSSFAERFEVLAPSQQMVLKLLAATPTAQIYGQRFVTAAQVANHSAISKAIKVLVDAELVRRREGVYELASPFLAAWLRGQ